MEILTLQRRLVEVGRIRLGAKKTTAQGKTYPARLTKFRLTSRDKPRLDAAAALYGGQVQEWDGQWELYTETDVLPVAVVPGQTLNQSFELWGQKPLPNGKKTGVICLRRCDGETEHLTGQSCLCAAADEQVCKPTTRLSVVLTEVPGLGVWRVEAHGWNAASELVGSVRLLESLIESRRPVRARLRLDFRTQVTEDETRQFVVPVLDIDHTLGQVLDALGHEAPAAIGNLTPVPALPAPVQSIAEQVAAVQDVKVKPRANAAVPIPATGLDVGPPLPERNVYGLDVVVLGQLEDEIKALAPDEKDQLRVWWKAQGFPPPRALDEEEVAVATEEIFRIVNERPFTDPEGTLADIQATRTFGTPAVLVASKEEYQRLADAQDRPPVSARDLGILARAVFDADYQAAPKNQKTKTLDRLRHAVIYATVGKKSASDCTDSELLTVYTRLEDMRDNGWRWLMNGDGVDFYGADGALTAGVMWDVLEPGDTP